MSSTKVKFNSTCISFPSLSLKVVSTSSEFELRNFSQMPFHSFFDRFSSRSNKVIFFNLSREKPLKLINASLNFCIFPLSKIQITGSEETFKAISDHLLFHFCIISLDIHPVHFFYKSIIIFNVTLLIFSANIIFL